MFFAFDIKKRQIRPSKKGTAVQNEPTVIVAEKTGREGEVFEREPADDLALLDVEYEGLGRPSGLALGGLSRG